MLQSGPAFGPLAAPAMRHSARLSGSRVDAGIFSKVQQRVRSSPRSALPVSAAAARGFSAADLPPLPPPPPPPRRAADAPKLLGRAAACAAPAAQPDDAAVDAAGRRGSSSRGPNGACLAVAPRGTLSCALCWRSRPRRLQPLRRLTRPASSPRSGSGRSQHRPGLRQLRRHLAARLRVPAAPASAAQCRRAHRASWLGTPTSASAAVLSHHCACACAGAHCAGCGVSGGLLQRRGGVAAAR